MESHNDITIDEILDSFRILRGVYEKEMVDTAIERKAEIIPRLIDILRNVISDPTPYLENAELYDHIYAVMLLGHLKVTEAHETIVHLFSLSDDIPNKIFSDITTSDLPMILLRTCGGSLEPIKAMALNRQVNDYCRTSALHAITYAVVEGIAAREEALAFFGTLFAGDETDSDSDFWGLLACNILELHPEESMDIIEKGYEDGLISPGMVGYDAFEKALEDGKEKTLERLKADYERDSLDDIHKCMSWWACFQEDDDTGSKPDLPDTFFDMPNNSSGKQYKKKNPTTKKKKRKQAKASKRKNRR